MSTYAFVYNSFIERFLDNKPIVNGLPLSDDNIRFPNDGKETPENQIWARLTLANGRATNIQAGTNGVSRTPGIFVIDIFAPKGTGSFEVNDVADQVSDLYRRKYFDKIRSNETQIQEIENTDDTYYQVQVSVFYNFDSCTT